jgi:hypothetical protein
LAFNHPVICNATKAEVIANNPKWFDIMDVSVVDGFNNKLTLGAGTVEVQAPRVATLLKQADFSLTRVIPTAGMCSIIESRPS